ncbi:MAG: CDP-diacylglycerol--serine O-phosphatidyltransferase [Fulvivirga sp.]
MNIKKHIPNTITCGNLLCGCLGSVFAFDGDPVTATYLLWLALLLDFFDGFAARMLHVSSPIGKELDSLADMVTFGVLPSVIMFKLIIGYTDSPFLPYIAFMIAIFSALRLAKFNIDDRQQTVFIGLPTPANALFISSLIFIVDSQYTELIGLISLVAITIIFSFLLVAPLELFSLKFKSFSWKDNRIRFTFLLISVLCIIAFQVLALPFIIISYIGLSILQQLMAGKVTSQ